MDNSRRRFLGQSLVLAASPRLPKHMPHLVLLGDSIFDNGRYTSGGPDVIAQVRQYLPSDWKASLLAVDGATTESIPSQLARLPADAIHLVMSVGGNNALRHMDVLDKRVSSTAEALDVLADIALEFDVQYRKAISVCQAGLAANYLHHLQRQFCRCRLSAPSCYGACRVQRYYFARGCRKQPESD